MYGRKAPRDLQMIRAHRGWEEVFKNTKMYNLNIGREFCASIIEEKSYCYCAYVQGVPITLSPSLVACILGIEEVLDYQFPFKSDPANPSFNQIASTLTGQYCSGIGIISLEEI